MGKHLHELLGWSGPMTHRQFRAWTEWLDLQWNEPDRSDFYAMQTAHEARFAFAEKKQGFRSEEYRIKFRKADRPEDQPRPRVKDSPEVAARKATTMAKVQLAAQAGVTAYEMGVTYEDLKLLNWHNVP